MYGGSQAGRRRAPFPEVSMEGFEGGASMAEGISGRIPIETRGSHNPHMCRVRKKGDTGPSDEMQSLPMRILL